MKSQRTAFILGYAGLIPFVLPAILIWFVNGEVAFRLETAQIVYAALIISFMGGVQWGYALKQGEIARKYQYIVSVLPTLMVFAAFMAVLYLKSYHIVGLFIVLLLFLAFIDQKTYIEVWFLKLRWLLTAVATVSLFSVGLYSYL